MIVRMRPVLALLATLAGLLGVVAAPAAAAPPPIKHVWVIQLENKAYDASFVNNMANQYLWRTLPQAGLLMTQYHGTGHASLDNYITQMSGQAPNPITQADCQTYMDVTPGIVGTDGQALGLGCVYPPMVKTLVDQLEAKGLTWKGYMQDMGNDPAREPATCGNPALNSQDKTQGAAANDQYAARHNPFVYFHSILDVPGRCQSHVVPLPPLADDLKTAATTPNFSWITPNLCDDGHDATPCAGPNSKGTKEGDLIAADAFLAKWVPVIMSSPAYKDDGLLMITFDESAATDTLACCAEPAGLNTPAPGITGPGGGRTGLVAVSPFITPGTQSAVPYNHYSFLKSMEQVFGIDEYLGYANMPGLVPFGDDVYNNKAGTTTMMPGPIKPGDAGSTGKAEPIKVKLRLSKPTRVKTLRTRLARKAGFRIRVVVTGTDRALNPVRVRLVKPPKKKGGRSTTLATTKAIATKDGSALVALKLSRAGRAKLRSGRYVLVGEVLHENAVLKFASVALKLR